jgi:hypothetical protein
MQRFIISNVVSFMTQVNILTFIKHFLHLAIEVIVVGLMARQLLLLLRPG